MPLFILPAITWLKDNWSKAIAPICTVLFSITLISLVKDCESYIAKNERLEIENQTRKLSEEKQNNITNNFAETVNKKEQKQKVIEQKIATESKKMYPIHKISNIINCEYQNFNNLDNECN